MAKVTVVYPLPVPTPPPIVTLELTYEEARFIADIIGGAVTGSSTGSRRKLGDGLYEAFQDAGIKNQDKINDFEGIVQFRDTKEIK